jgi:hypothetical protein
MVKESLGEWINAGQLEIDFGEDFNAEAVTAELDALIAHEGAETGAERFITDDDWKKRAEDHRQERIQQLRADIASGKVEVDDDDGNDEDVEHASYSFDTEKEADAFIMGLEAVYRPDIDDVTKKQQDGQWVVEFTYDENC